VSLLKWTLLRPLAGAMSVALPPADGTQTSSAPPWKPPDSSTVCAGERRTTMRLMSGDHTGSEYSERACVTCTGYVDDVRPFVDRAAVFIAPLRSGSGTKVKILNAMSQGKPVVTTSVGAEGIDALPDHEILIADDEKEFARKVLHLLQHPQEAAAIGRRARQVVKKLYDWKVVTAGMSAIYEQAVYPEAGRVQAESPEQFQTTIADTIKTG